MLGVDTSKEGDVSQASVGMTTLAHQKSIWTALLEE